MIRIDPALCDSLEEVLLASRRFALLEALSRRRDESSPAFESAYRRLRACRALGLADEEAAFDRALQLGPTSPSGLEVLASYAVTRKDATKLVRVRIWQFLCDAGNATRRSQLLQGLSRLKGNSAIASLSEFLQPLAQASSPSCRVFRAQALDKWGDDATAARDAWVDSAGCPREAYATASALQIAQALMRHSAFRSGLEMLQLAWQLVDAQAQDLRTLRQGSLRAVAALPWGQDAGALFATPQFRNVVGEGFAKSLAKSQRWDLLTQLRLVDYCCAGRTVAQRKRLVMALDQCHDAPGLQALSLVGARFRYGELDIAKILAKLKRFASIDKLLQAAPDRLPFDRQLLALWLDSLVKRDDAAGYRAALSALALSARFAGREKAMAVAKLLPLDRAAATQAFVVNWTQHPLQFNPLLARIVALLPWGEMMPSLEEWAALEAPSSDTATRTLVRLKRWDLLAQLRLLEYFAGGKAVSARARLVTVLRHCDDTTTPIVLRGIAERFEGGAVDVARLLGRIGNDRALEHFVAASTPQASAPAMLLMLAERLSKRGDVAAAGRALRDIADHPDATARERVVAIEQLVLLDIEAGSAAFVQAWRRPGTATPAFTILSPRIVNAIAWGQQVPSLELLADTRDPASAALARLLSRLQRWDLLLQLRVWQLSQAISRQQSRLALLAALRRCHDPASLQSLWEVAANVPGARVEVVRLLGKLERFEDLDALIDATPGELPADENVASAWAETFAERGDPAACDELFRALLEQPTTPIEWTERQAVRFKQRRQWNLLDWVRLRQFRDDPSQKLRVSSHLKAVQAAEGAVGVARFLTRLALASLDDGQAAAYVRRVLYQQRPDLVATALKTWLLTHPDDLDARLELVEQWDFTDATARSKWEFGEQVALAHAALAKLPRTARSEAEPANREIEPIQLPYGSKLAALFTRYGERLSIRYGPLVEALAAATHRRGTFEIWSGYAENDIKSHERERRPNDIRVAKRSGEFLAWLVESSRATECLEIGSGFGTSGMYISAALEECGTGRLRSYEPNAEWSTIADANIKAISARGAVYNSTFEQASADLPSGIIGFAFIDAIHTPEAVATQLALVRSLCRAGALVVIDDINFSKRMYKYWRGLASSGDFIAAAEFFGRFGILELP